VSIGDGIDLNLADSGDVLRERILKLAALRTPLDAWLDQSNDDVEAHLLDHFLSFGVTSTVGFVLNSGGSKWKRLRNNEGQRENEGVARC
jgi:hypothetical protein